MRRARTSVVLVVLAAAAIAHRPARGQNPQQQGSAAAGRLALTTSSAAAKAEFWAGLEDWQSATYTSGLNHFRRAAALDDRFALARVYATGEYAVTQQQLIDRDLAVADAARQSTEEGLLALFWREKAQHNGEKERVLLRAAMQLMPNEPAIPAEYIWAMFNPADPKPTLDTARAYRAKFPTYGPLAFATAVFSMAASDTAGALRAAQEYIRVAPQTPTSYGYYGGLLQQLGRTAEAEVQYRKGMALLPAHADYGNDAASALAELYAMHGKYVEARAVATEALSRVTSAYDSAMYMTELAGTYFATGDNRQGMQLLEQAREKSTVIGNGAGPDRLDAILAIANATYGDGRSVSMYLDRLRPTDAQDSTVTLLMRARAYGFAGQLDSALAASDRLANNTSVDGRVPWSHHLRGLAFANAKQCARALPELAQAADTASFEVLDARAQCEMQLGHKPAALALRDRALASQEFSLFYTSLIRSRLRLAQMK
ncbi:MAG: hypothetical protein ACJ796_05140 [Gemmatimonadaceae bacterium]